MYKDNTISIAGPLLRDCPSHLPSLVVCNHFLTLLRPQSLLACQVLQARTIGHSFFNSIHDHDPLPSPSSLRASLENHPCPL